MSDVERVSKPHPEPRLAAICSIIVMCGAVIAIVADLVGGFVVNDYNPVAETISDLAAGKRSWILDTGIQIFAICLMVVSIALWRWYLDSWRWRIGCVLLFTIGLNFILIARHDTYGDGVAGGVEIHIYLVYILAATFPVTVLLMEKGLGHIHQFWSYFSIAIALGWVVFGLGFFAAPDAWDGAVERVVAIVFLMWTGAIARLLWCSQHLRNA